MRIWIDLANSPQVLFFRPIIRALQARGHVLRISSRHFAQTAALADDYGLAHEPIGSHGGRSVLNAVKANVGRAVALARWVQRGEPIDLALSHNSYSQALAALWLRRPLVTLMDYEHQPLNHVCFRLARRVIVPEPFPAAFLRTLGAGTRARRYAGIKEQVYLSDFIPSQTFLHDIGLPAENVLVVMRPPGPWGAYHRFENRLFDDVLDAVASAENTLVIFLPRVREQADEMRARGRRNVLVADRTYDGPNLLYHADVVISGGGTMNREAAVLGTPTFTVFKGRLSAVDQYLIDRGRMLHIGTQADIARIPLTKRGRHAQLLKHEALVEHITDMILEAA